LVTSSPQLEQFLYFDVIALMLAVDLRILQDLPVGS
jgi:hypothetical protein